MDTAAESHLAKLSADSRQRVVRDVAHRLANAVAPLALHLEAEAPETVAANPTLRAAGETVRRIRALISELQTTALAGP